MEELIRRFGVPGAALVLMGSHARGDAGPFSDVDLVRFLPDDQDEKSGDGSFLNDGRLVVVSSVVPSEVDAWFTQPEQAVTSIEGLRAARLIAGPAWQFEQLQARAIAFTWDEQMQNRARRWVRDQMAGWVEEAHKGLEGLRRHDVGRMLNARFGLSWGLAWVLTVWYGILLFGDNTFYDQVRGALSGAHAVRLLDRSFGVVVDEPDHALEAQVRAGLEFYCLVAATVQPALTGAEGELISRTAKRIDAWLAEHMWS